MGEAIGLRGVYDSVMAKRREWRELAEAGDLEAADWVEESTYLLEMLYRRHREWPDPAQN